METDTCTQHGIKGYPTLLLFLNGIVNEKYTDKRDLDSLVNFVERNVPDDQVSLCVCVSCIYMNVCVLLYCHTH